MNTTTDSPLHNRVLLLLREEDPQSLVEIQEMFATTFPTTLPSLTDWGDIIWSLVREGFLGTVLEEPRGYGCITRSLFYLTEGSPTRQQQEEAGVRKNMLYTAMDSSWKTPENLFDGAARIFGQDFSRTIAGTTLAYKMYWLDQLVLDGRAHTRGCTAFPEYRVNLGKGTGMRMSVGSTPDHEGLAWAKRLRKLGPICPQARAR